MAPPIKLALIYGSAREGRFCDTVARWAAAQIESRPEFSLHTIDPAALDLARDGETLRRRIGQADAFVVVTPEYNHSFPAPLKALIDSAYHEWQAKPVGFVSYGGISGGLRAVEQLRLVFAELHAVGLRDTVSFANAHQQFGADGTPLDGQGATRAMATLLSRLAWWALALREAREARPYEGAAA